MDNCLVVCSQTLDGVPGHLADVIQDAFVIAVDGGLNHLQKMKIKPSLWVGDGDSTKAQAIKSLKCSRLKLPVSKDYSDLEYALHAAGKAFLNGDWDGTLILIGAQGGRFDHEIGNWLVAQRWLEDLSQAVGVENCPGLVSYGVHGMWLATMNEVMFHQPKKKLFTVFSPGRTTRVSITGAKYKLKNKILAHASTGVSNEGLGKAVQVKISSETTAPVFVVFPN